MLLLTAAACRQSPGGQEGSVAVVNPVDNNAQPTVVYLVRHAEKDISNPSEQDPDLTPGGLARAEALRDLLEEQEIAALYTTKYKRNRSTLQPLAEAEGLQMKVYEAHSFNSLKDTILKDHAGQTVVVVGHSNTVLPIIEEFGAKRPVPDISETQYDYLFKVTVLPDGTATVVTVNYGVASR